MRRRKIQFVNGKKTPHSLTTIMQLPRNAKLLRKLMMYYTFKLSGRDDSQKENDSFKNLYEDAMKMLSIKDEMIWELLQERDAMRKESDAMMKELHDVSQASASELQEWAR